MSKAKADGHTITQGDIFNRLLPAMENSIAQYRPIKEKLTSMQLTSWQNIQRTYIANKRVGESMRKQRSKNISDIAEKFCLLEDFVVKTTAKGEFCFKTAEDKKRHFEEFEKLEATAVDLSYFTLFKASDLQILPAFEAPEFQYQLEELIDYEN